MPKVSGSVTLWFEGVEFEDDAALSIRDQAVEALEGEVFGRGEVIEVVIDTLSGAA
jgi:hypothetical protein